MQKRKAAVEQFCQGELQNFANWAAEFGKIFSGKL